MKLEEGKNCSLIIRFCCSLINVWKNFEISPSGNSVCTVFRVSVMSVEAANKAAKWDRFIREKKKMHLDNTAGYRGNFESWCGLCIYHFLPRTFMSKLCRCMQERMRERERYLKKKKKCSLKISSFSPWAAAPTRRGSPQAAAVFRDAHQPRCGVLHRLECGYLLQRGPALGCRGNLCSCA